MQTNFLNYVKISDKKTEVTAWLWGVFGFSHGRTHISRDGDTQSDQIRPLLNSCEHDPLEWMLLLQRMVFLWFQVVHKFRPTSGINPMGFI